MEEPISQDRQDNSTASEDNPTSHKSLDHINVNTSETEYKNDLTRQSASDEVELNNGLVQSKKEDNGLPVAHNERTNLQGEPKPNKDTTTQYEDERKKEYNTPNALPTSKHNEQDTEEESGASRQSPSSTTSKAKNKTDDKASSKSPSPPTSAKPARKKSGSILKKPSQSREKTDTPPKSADFYVDASGNMRQINANSLNSNQFFPDLSSARGASAAVKNRQLEDETFGSSQAPIRQASAKTVTFDESGPQVTELEDEEHYELVEYEDDDIDSVMRGERPYSADSISLPTTSPGPSRDTESTEIFTTQVEEETLEAAKIRQKRRTYILEVDALEPVVPVLPSMTQIVSSKATAHYEEGLVAMKSQQYEKAILRFSKSLSLNPQQVECYARRAEAYLQLTDFQSAILNYKKACIMQPDNVSYYQRLAFIYFFQGECLFNQKLYPEALEAFTRASEMRPDLTGYHIRSIACLAALERHGECLALVNKRLETDDTNADLYIMRARLHQLFKNTTLCYYDVKDALVIEPTHTEARKLMADLEVMAEQLKQEAVQLSLMRKPRDALQKISLSIEANPSVADYHILRGALQRQLCDFNAAIDDYLLALDKTNHNETSPVYLEAQRQLLLTYNDFAVECFTKGFYEEAIILLNKAIKGEKREKGLYVNRGDCFYKQGNLAFALADYHQALEMDLKDDTIRTRISVVHNDFAIQEFQEKNYKEAESRFSQSIQFNPTVGQYYISRAKARLAQEDMSGARSDMLMALLLDSNNADIVSLMPRLFPHKSVKDVLSSRAAAAARNVLDKINSQQGGPHRLQPLQLEPETARGKVTQNAMLDIGTTWQKGHVLPSLRACMREREFHIRVIMEKNKVKAQLKKLMDERDSLNYQGGRVRAFVEPVPPAGAPRETLAVTADASRPTGWRKFSLGIGLGGT